MCDKNDLMSIGEMSKLTGVGIQALRYYEKKNILKPAYTDPDTGYRYYTAKQIDCVVIIADCVALKIPLKELIGLFETEDFDRLQNFFLQNKKIAEEKLSVHKTMVNLADKALQKMETGKLYKFGQIYEREMPEKNYYVKLFEQPPEYFFSSKRMIEFSNEAKAELLSRVAKLDNPNELEESMVLLEHGLLREISPNGNRYYAFCEIPKCLADENTLTISQGIYTFRQDKISRIEEAPKVLEHHLEGLENYLLIEAEEVISGKSKINEPTYELRVVGL